MRGGLTTIGAFGRYERAVLFIFRPGGVEFSGREVIKIGLSTSGFSRCSKFFPLKAGSAGSLGVDDCFEYFLGVHVCKGMPCRHADIDLEGSSVELRPGEILAVTDLQAVTTVTLQAVT